MSQHPGNEEQIASMILRDVPVALGLARPNATRAAFDWLGRAFSEDVYSPPIDRMVNAWGLAEPDIQAKTRDALMLAIDRAATTWLGAERTLALLDWAHEIAPEGVPASRWIALLFHRSPHDEAETAYWVRQIVERLNRWQFNLHALFNQTEGISDRQWIQLVLSTSERDRVDVARWLLELLNSRQDKCRAVWDAVVKPWKTMLPDLPEGYCDWYADIIDPLAEAANHPSFALEVYEDASTSRRRALASYAGEANDWPLATEDLIQWPPQQHEHAILAA